MFGKNFKVGYNNNMKTGVIIIGAGPAGLTAGIFACRAGLDVVCIEKLAVGGQAGLSYKIENYPGIEKISGYDLTEKMFNHAVNSGLKVEYGDVESLTQTKTGFMVKTKTKTYTANKVIIASGSLPRKLNAENENKFLGKGVSYCASCDGNFFKGLTVAVVGGGNSAIEYVDYLTNIAKKVYLINRTENFRAGAHEIERIKAYKNLEIITNASVKKLFGQTKLESAELNINGKSKQIKLDGLFVAIGHMPDLSFANLDLKTDDHGYIITNQNMETNIKNLFACGDIVSKNFRQVITACADGAIAGNACIGGK